MKIKVPTDFVTFNDGRLSVFETVANKPGPQKVAGIRFGERTVSFKRFYAARTASTEISRVVHIPYRTGIDPHDNVVIGSERYKIEQLQPVRDTNPPCMVLTLKRIGAIS